MFSAPMTAVTASIQAVIDLFDDALAEVRFADLDAARLKALAGEAESAAVALAAQQAALEAARATLAERQEALLVQAQRALAYARVYAEHDAPLTERLNGISLPRAPKATRPKPTVTEARHDNAPTPNAVAPEAVEAVEAVTADADAAPLASTHVELDAELDDSAAKPAVSVRKGKRKDAARTVVQDDAG